MSASTPAPAESTRKRDPNSLDLSIYKGDIRICPFCKPLDRLSGRSCPFCMSRGYVAACLNCDGTGLCTAKSIWDGKSDHSSTCNMCGGKGLFPATEKAFVAAGGKTQEMIDADTETKLALDGRPDSVPVSTSPMPMPTVINPMQNLQITRGKNGSDKSGK